MLSHTKTNLQQMWSSISDHRNGVGFYADPLGKPSLLAHWRGLVEFSLSSVTLAPKQTTEEGLAAARAASPSPPSSSSSPDWDGDGVTVRRKKDYWACFFGGDFLSYEIEVCELRPATIGGSGTRGLSRSFVDRLLYYPRASPPHSWPSAVIPDERGGNATSTYCKHS